MHKNTFYISLMVGVAAAASAHAQALESTFQRDKNVSVTQRPRPGYEALGLRAGGLTIYPKVTLDVAHEDNIFFTNTNEESDTIYSVRPSVEVVSNWSRHQFRALAQANTYKFDKFSDEDNTTYQVTGRGRIDIQRQTFINVGAGFEHLVEARYNPTVQQFISEPVEYDNFTANIGASREVNRLRVSGEVRYGDWQYNDTRVGNTVLDLGYRDRKTLNGELRVDYAISPALAVYAFGAANEQDYARSTIINDVERDSDGWEAAVGADFELTDLTRGQIQVGYLSQSYDDPRIGDATGLALRSRLEWFPTELTTVTFQASRSIEDTGVIGAGGILATRASARVDHELLRNLIVTAQLSWAEEDYRGIDRKDDQTTALIGVNYLLNNNVGIFGQYNFQTRDTSGVLRGIEYDANRFQIGLVLQY